MTLASCLLALALGGAGGTLAHWIWQRGVLTLPQRRYVILDRGKRKERLEGYHPGWIGYCVAGAFTGLFNHAFLQNISGIAFENIWAGSVVYGFFGGVCFDLLFLWLRTTMFGSVYNLESTQVSDLKTTIEQLTRENRALRKYNDKLRVILFGPKKKP